MKTHFLWGRVVALTVLGVTPLAAPRLLAGELKPRDTLEEDGSPYSLAFSPDAKTLASASATDVGLSRGFGTVRLWDVKTCTNSTPFKGHTDVVSSVAYSPDGKTLASGSSDGTVRLWDVKTGKNTATFTGHRNHVHSVAYSPDGKTLAVGSSDITVGFGGVESKNMAILLWDVKTGKNTATFKGHTDAVRCVAFSPDGKMLASGGLDKTIKLWEVATGKERATFRGHRNGVYCVAFSPDGKTLASGRGDKTLKLWDVKTGQQRISANGDHAVCSVAFSPDGKILASASFIDSTITLWDVPPADRAEPRRSTALSGTDLDGLWDALSHDDAVKAYQAISTLVLAPEQAVPLLKSRLQPVPQPDTRQITGWITDLDSPRFVVRQKATQALEKVGDLAEPAFRIALSAKPSPEVRRRIEQLLTRIEQLRPDSLRAVRAVEVLEHIGNRETKRLLAQLATGADGARLTREAKASLGRLDRRPASGK